MSYTTNIPSITYSATGLVIPTESQVLTGALADQAAAFGADINPGLTTPQGQIAMSTTAIVSQKNGDIAYVLNQFNPLTNSGRWQDAIGQIYFQKRIAAQATVVNCLCSGGAGVVIPEGSIVQDESGNLYASNVSATIGSGGTVTIEFQNQVAGPIACPANTVTTIYQAQPGWDSVNNPTAGAVGQNVETAIQFESRRQATVAKNSINMNQSLRGTLLDVAGVVDAYVIDNYQAYAVVVGGVTLPANSLYICVSGGAESDIAEAIWLKKPPGIPMTGNTSYVVSDDSSGYVMPYPQYTITYQVPYSLSINAIVTLKNNTSVPSNVVALIDAALATAFTSGFGGIAQIGATLYASSFYAAISGLGNWVEIIDIELSASVVAGFTGSIAGTVLTVTAMTQGTIQTGYLLNGFGVTANTTIASLGSGTGGTGTYNVSLSQTVASEAMTTSLAQGKYITAGINQQPVLGSVTVTLA
jgi:uncharacterized phage protein gp47/JayE